MAPGRPNKFDPQRDFDVKIPHTKTKHTNPWWQAFKIFRLVRRNFAAIGLPLNSIGEWIMKGSWKTTSAGVLGILGTLCALGAAQFDGDPTTVANWAVALPTIIASIGLLFARDNNKTSEDVGAKK
jgi:hypothetical protein